MHAAIMWVKKIESTRSAEVKRNSLKVLRSILRELLTNFGSNGVRKFAAKVQAGVPEISLTDLSRAAEEHEPIDIRSSMDYPIKYREAGDRNQDIQREQLHTYFPKKQ
jgi:hypothetical protein